MAARIAFLRTGTRAVLILGILASVAANVLHAHDNAVSQVIAAWPPLALFVTIELIARVPVRRMWLTAVRIVGTAVIAGIAAWVSYWHMADVTAAYGETGAAPYLIPLTVDGLVVVASVCLVELNAAARARTEAATAAVPDQAPAVVSVGRKGARQASNGRAKRGQAAKQVAAILAERPDVTPAQVAASVPASRRHIRRLLSDLRRAANGRAATSPSE